MIRHKYEQVLVVWVLDHILCVVLGKHPQCPVVGPVPLAAWVADPNHTDRIPGPGALEPRGEAVPPACLARLGVIRMLLIAVVKATDQAASSG